ncbi:MAG: rhomboid family protein [Ilumatobacteraceae bacterium]|nr:rhomboid family protein [Ilumatobacteraceae bacterium]MCU1390758.1 rhomboid family protein [Ilumatobacteraceae bacterium]
MSLPQPPTITHCYRHPERETGRRCTRCEKPACSDCLTQAPVGSLCVDCLKAAQPDLKTRVKYASAKQPVLVTYILMAINVAVFLYVGAKDSSTFGGGIGSTGSVSRQQFDLGLNREVLHVTHHWYTLVTSGFLHFGVLHIALNMYLLYLLGQLLERNLGRTKFALIYMACLLGGSAGVLLINQNAISGGASGAVFGLMAAAAFSMHRQGINIMQTGIGRTLAINLVLTFVIGGISIGGHLGGIVAGVACGATMMAPKWKPMPKWVPYAAPIAVGLVAIIVSVGLAS